MNTQWIWGNPFLCWESTLYPLLDVLNLELEVELELRMELDLETIIRTNSPSLPVIGDLDSGL